MVENLSKEDIFLMMKSYENNVKYNTQLYDRQEILVKEQTKVIDNLKNITIEQQKVNTQLGTLITTLTDHNSVCNTNVTDISKTLTDNNLNNVKEHGNLRYHLIGISGGLLVVVIALIAALEKIWSKSDIIDAVAKYIGIS
jgi:hypothetical protein